MKLTLFQMLQAIYEELDQYGYSELDCYECGLKDILNLLDCRMSDNDENEMFIDIMTTIKNHHNQRKEENND